MTKLTELVERVRSECADAYGNANHYEKLYDIKISRMNPGESQLIYYASVPFKCFSKWNFLLPKSLRAIVREPSSHHFPAKGLKLYHYNVRYSLIRKEAVFSEKHGEALGLPDFKAEEFLKRFQKRYGKNLSCIYPEWTGTGEGRNDNRLPVIVGRRDLNQQVVDFLKEGGDVIDFFMGIRPKRVGEVERPFWEENIGYLTIYDLLKRPKKVHLEL